MAALYKPSVLVTSIHFPLSVKFYSTGPWQVVVGTTCYFGPGKLGTKHTCLLNFANENFLTKVLSSRPGWIKRWKWNEGCFSARDECAGDANAEVNGDDDNNGDNNDDDGDANAGDDLARVEFQQIFFSWSWSWRLNFEPESIRCLHLEQKSLKTQSSFFPFLIWKLKPRLRLKNDRSLRRLLMILPETTSSGWRSPELTCYETCPWLGGRAVWGFSNTCDWTNARLLATLSSQRCHQLSTALHNCRAVKKQNFLMARPGQRCQTN